MDRVRQVAEDVAVAFASRRRKLLQLTRDWVRAEPALARHRNRLETRLENLADWQLEVDALESRLRARFAGRAWAATFDDGTAEAQQLVRQELARQLTDDGLPPEEAGRLADSYSIGALLHTD